MYIFNSILFQLLYLLLIVTINASNMGHYNTNLQTRRILQEEIEPHWINNINLHKEGEKQDDSISKEIGSLSNIAGLENLRNIDVNQSDYELRIWVGFGNFSPGSFIFRKVNSDFDSHYISFSHLGNEKKVTKKKLNLSQKALSNFYYNLKNNGFLPTMKFYKDKNHISDPDEAIIVVEIKQNQKYKMFWFPGSTSSRQGQKIFKLIDKVENLFKIKLP